MDGRVASKLDTFFGTKTIRYRKDDNIIHPGGKVEYVYLLKKGFIKQSLMTRSGDDLTLNMFHSISFFPIMLLLADIENRYYFTAMSDVIVKKARSEDVLKLLKSDKEITFDLTIRFAEGICGLLNKVESMMYKDSYLKLASLLVYLADKLGEKDKEGVRIVLSLTHGDIATWLGIQRETVSRQFEKLRKKKIIGYSDNKILIYSLDRLKEEIEYNS